MEHSKMIKSRIRILVSLACLAVALVFGLSYYFGLIATESAITANVPELEDLVGPFKSALLVNTIIFACIIIASFFALTVLITERMFKPLTSLQEDMDLLAKGRMPKCDSEMGHGPFSSLEISFRSACKRIESDASKLIADLEDARELAGTNDKCAGKLNEIVDNYKRFIGEIKSVEQPVSDAEADDSVFMQPV